MKRIKAFALCFALCFSALQAEVISVIPRPAKMEVGQGVFTFKQNVKVAVPKFEGDSVKNVFNTFKVDFEKATGLELETTKKAQKADMVLSVNPELAAEAYRLQVTADKINISAAHPVGFFYAFQTLKQLMPRNVMAARPAADVKTWTVPVVDIDDAPRFGWRGFMLDEGRHFYGKEAIKDVIDILATYKMNRFHWH